MDLDYMYLNPCERHDLQSGDVTTDKGSAVENANHKGYFLEPKYKAPLKP